MEARDAGDVRDLVEGQRPAEMAFDKPQRLLRGIHGSGLSFRSIRIMRAAPQPRLTVLAAAPQKLPCHGKYQHSTCWSQRCNRAYWTCIRSDGSKKLPNNKKRL